MTLALLTVVALVAALLRFTKRRRASRALFVATVAAFFAIGCGLVPAWLLRALQAPYAARPAIEWGERNAIVMLGLGTEKIAATGRSSPARFPIRGSSRRRAFIAIADVRARMPIARSS